VRFYTRFVRAKKGMSTIFGALFFVILILMGFNLMLWNFAQFDAYNRVITTMGLSDQQRSAEGALLRHSNPNGLQLDAVELRPIRRLQ